MRTSVCFFILFSLLPVFAAESLRLDVQEFDLSNGLKILILERHDSPTFAAQMVFKVGSVDERPGITGVAHLLEHMMYKGTQIMGIKDYQQELPLLKGIEAVGVPLWEEKAKGEKADQQKIVTLQKKLDELQAQHRKLVLKDELWETYLKNGAAGLNASTGSDYTHYYCSIPSNRLELWCWLESDRMRSPVFREFYSERDVVTEERRRSIDNNPQGLLWEQLVGAAFIAHPYQWPVIGWMSDICTIRREEVEEFWRIHYAPNNCTLVFVGDVRPNQALPMIERYFGAIPSQPPPGRVETVEPEQRGERRVEVEFDAEPMVFLGYHKPAIDSPDQYVLDILESLLSEGRTSRLYRSLVLEKQIAVEAKAYGGPDKYPGLFIFVLVPRSPHTAADVLAAFDAEMEKMIAQPVEANELQKVKNRLRVDFIRGLETNEGLANKIAYYEGLYGWKYVNTLLENWDAITPADIQRVAGKYFIRSNRTMAQLVKPSESKGGAQ
ncbi:MAG TPA: pitrilysin family protein [bacterium]|nr:pitrilysin family protein [bacterium]